MMELKHGIFDEASISVIALDTVDEIGRLAERSLDVRRFRPNLVVRLLRPIPFQEDEWVGGALSFGNGDDAPTIAVTMRDVRCSMVNLDPESATPAPQVLKAVVRAHQDRAGISGAVTRIGQLEVGRYSSVRRPGKRNVVDGGENQEARGQTDEPRNVPRQRSCCSVGPTFSHQADFFVGRQNSITFPRSCGGSHFTRIEDLLGM